MPPDPEESPGFLLWHITLRWQREIAAALAPLGLTHVQFVLLAATWWLNARGELAIQAVAAVEGVDAAFISASPDPAALLAVLRPLARRDGADRPAVRPGVQARWITADGYLVPAVSTIQTSTSAWCCSEVPHSRSSG